MKASVETGARKTDRLPQSESEWLATGMFTPETIEVGDYRIRCALANGAGKDLLTMSGGIPRDPERRKNLPLVNKLYGRLALDLLNHGSSSVLYNQPATGGSSGNWESDTFKSRASILSEVAEHYSQCLGVSEVSLIGSSAAGCMAIDSVEDLQSRGLKVAKLVLLSPGAYPAEAETVAYCEKFGDIIREPWDITESPSFSKLEKYITSGGSALITFFEVDNPPIPPKIELHYRKMAERLAENGGDITVETIPGVGHNFTRLNPKKGRNIIDDNSVRKTASFLVDFLTKPKGL